MFWLFLRITHCFHNGFSALLEAKKIRLLSSLEILFQKQFPWASSLSMVQRYLEVWIDTFEYDLKFLGMKAPALMKLIIYVIWCKTVEMNLEMFQTLGLANAACGQQNIFLNFRLYRSLKPELHLNSVGAQSTHHQVKFSRFRLAESKTFETSSMHLLLWRFFRERNRNICTIPDILTKRH